MLFPRTGQRIRPDRAWKLLNTNLETGPRGIAVAITDRPPHRSVRAELPHTALTLDSDERTALQDKDG